MLEYSSSFDTRSWLCFTFPSKLKLIILAPIFGLSVSLPLDYQNFSFPWPTSGSWFSFMQLMFLVVFVFIEGGGKVLSPLVYQLRELLLTQSAIYKLM